MKPELPAPQFTPEQASMGQERSSEYGQQLPTPERIGETSPEREQYMQGADRQPVPVQSAPVIPVPMPQPAPVPAPAVVSDDNPAIAGDDDLIEKEWVDRAKKIIIDTKDDPYRREREVNKLQIDYLRKRYGKELGSAD